MDDEPAVDVLEIARFLGVSTSTVYSMVKSGEIPAVRVGRMWRFWPSRVREHLERQAAERDPWAYTPQMLAAHRGWESRRARGRG